MCRFLRLQPGKFPSPRLRSQRLTRASVSDRNRKALPDRSTLFLVYERGHRVAMTRGFLNRPAGLSLREKVPRILIPAQRRAVRCCQPADRSEERRVGKESRVSWERDV